MSICAGIGSDTVYRSAIKLMLVFVEAAYCRSREPRETSTLTAAIKSKGRRAKRQQKVLLIDVNTTPAISDSAACCLQARTAMSKESVLSFAKMAAFTSLHRKWR